MRRIAWPVCSTRRPGRATIPTDPTAAVLEPFRWTNRSRDERDKLEQALGRARSALERAGAPLQEVVDFSRIGLHLLDLLIDTGEVEAAEGVVNEVLGRLSKAIDLPDTSTTNRALLRELGADFWMRHGVVTARLIERAERRERTQPDLIPDALPPDREQIEVDYRRALEWLGNPPEEGAEVSTLGRHADAHSHLAILLDDLGRPEEAFTHYRMSLHFAEEAAKHAAPEDMRTRSALALAHNAIGHHYNETGRLQDARPHHQRSLEINEQLAGLDPKDPYWVHCLATDHENLADLAGRLRDPERRLAHAVECAALRRRIADHESAPLEWLFQNLDAERLVAVSLQDLGRDDDAIQRLRATVDELQGRCEKAPEEELIVRWTDALLTLGYALEDVGRTREAMDRFKDALRTSQKLIARHPDEPRFHIFAAHCHLCTALASLRLDDPKGADRSAERGLRVLEGQLARHPRDRMLWIELAQFRNELAALHSRRDRLDEAAEHYIAGLQALETLLQLQPDDTEILGQLAIAHDSLANLLERLHRLDDARLHRAAAVAAEKRLVELDPENIDFQTRLCQALLNQAHTEFDDERLEDADAVLRDARKRLHRLGRLVPDDEFVRGLSAQTERLGGEVLRDLNRRGEAEKALARSRDEFAKLIEALPDPRSWFAAQAETLEALGELLIDDERGREAVDDLRLAVERRRTLASFDPSDPQTHRELAHTLESFGEALDQAGERASAQRARSESTQLFDRYGEEP